MTATRKIPHGTLSGYIHHRCRCAKCKAAKATYVRERGYNQRVGAVAKRKRQADANLRHPCEACGALCERTARRCDACRRAAARAARDARWAEIQRRWLAGESYRQIALVIGSTPAAIHDALVKMRRAGWNMPRRGPRGKVLA